MAVKKKERNRAGRLPKDLLDLSCQFDLTFVVGSVHFGNQSLKHRRTRRNFCDGNVEVDGLDKQHFEAQKCCRSWADMRWDERKIRVVK